MFLKKKLNINFKFTKPLNFLGVKTVVKDLKELPTMYKYIFTLIGIIMVFLSFFDINHFIDPKADPSIWSVVNALQANAFMPQWINATLYSLSGLASFTGIICVFLAGFGKMSTFFWGVINAVITALFAFDYGYAGDAQLYVFVYLPTQFIGWYTWEKSIKDNMQSGKVVSDSNVIVRESKWWIVLPVAIVVAALVSLAWYYEIDPFFQAVTGGHHYAYVNAPVPHSFDAIGNGLGITAQALMMFRLREQWSLWMVYNLVSLAMFSGINKIGTHNGTINVNMIIEMLFFSVNTITGWLVWNHKIDPDTGKFIKKAKPAHNQLNQNLAI